jgi:DNA-binding LacI/PurR family transcriptional regulator
MVPLRTDMYVPVMMEIAMAVATAARTHGYDILLLTGEEGAEAVRRIEGSALADAMIVMDVELDDDRLPLLRAANRPAVLIGLPSETAGLNCVDLDFAAAGAVCAEHLAGLGHREIAVIGEAAAVYERHTGFAERTLAGLRERSAELGLRLLHRPCEGSYASVSATLSRVFDERPGTTAFVVQNEAATDPLLALLRQSGRAVPEDVSVVAVCPEQVAAHASVPLTSVAVPAQEMGRRAVEQVIAKIEGRGSDEEVVLLAPELTVRESAAQAPAET